MYNRKVIEKGLWADKQLMLMIKVNSNTVFGLKSNFNVSKSGLTVSVHCMQVSIGKDLPQLYNVCLFGYN